MDGGKEGGVLLWFLPFQLGKNDVFQDNLRHEELIGGRNSIVNIP